MNEPNFALAERYRRNGRGQLALEEYRKAVALAPRNAYAHFRLGDALADSFFYHEAAAELELAVELAPQNAFYHFWLADLYTRCDQIESAIAEMQQASMFSPQDSYYNLRLGVLYAMSNQLDDAAEALLQAVQLNPVNAVYHAILADILFALGCESLAMRHLELAGELDCYDIEQVRQFRKMTASGAS